MISLLDPRLYLAFAIACGASYGAGRWQQWKSDDRAHQTALVKAHEAALTQEREWARLVKGTTDEKDRQISAIRGRLDDALERLRKRPERMPEAARPACEGATGRELSGRDAAFLERLAARADELRAQLKACQDREHGGTE